MIIMIIQLYNKNNINLVVKLIYNSFCLNRANAGLGLLYGTLQKILNITTLSNRVIGRKYIVTFIKYIYAVLSRNKTKSLIFSKKQFFFILKQLTKATLKEIKVSLCFLKISPIQNPSSLGKIKINFKSRNIFVNILSSSGKNIKSFSSGSLGFVGREKSTVIACRELSKVANKIAVKHFLLSDLEFIGKKGHTKVILEGLLRRGLRFVNIKHLDRVPHGGCRLQKKPRK